MAGGCTPGRDCEAIIGCVALCSCFSWRDGGTHHKDVCSLHCCSFHLKVLHCFQVLPLGGRLPSAMSLRHLLVPGTRTLVCTIPAQMGFSRQSCINRSNQSILDLIEPLLQPNSENSEASFVNSWSLSRGSGSMQPQHRSAPSVIQWTERPRWIESGL